MSGFLDFLFIVFFIPMGAVLIVGALSIYVMNREKRDTTFSNKMDRFRERFKKFSVTRRSQKIILWTIILVVLIYYAYTGQVYYNPDEFH